MKLSRDGDNEKNDSLCTSMQCAILFTSMQNHNSGEYLPHYQGFGREVGSLVVCCVDERLL